MEKQREEEAKKAQRERKREKRKLCQAVGSEQFLCLSTVSCVCVCVFSSAVRWGYPLTPLCHYLTSLRAELFACFLPRCTRIQLIMNS